MAAAAPATERLVTGQDHQVTPSPAVLAHDLERQLRTIHDALASLERDVKEHHRGSTAHSDAIVIAREHVASAIDALQLASRK